MTSIKPSDVAMQDNITRLPLPPKCPKFIMIENAWQFMRQNWQSNRVLQDYDVIVAHCCHHWNHLID